MTDLTSPVPDDLAAPRTGPPLTAYGLALLPLGLAGLLPLWGAVLLCGLFALGVRLPAWGQGRLLITQLIIGLSVAAQVPAALGQPRQLLAVAGGYLLLSLSGVALTWGAQALEDGERRGLLGLLPGLLAPQPGLILALAGGALARPGRDARHAGQVAPAWWAWAVGGVLAVALLSALLPSPRPDIGAALTPPATSDAALPGPPAASAGRPADPVTPDLLHRGQSAPGVQVNLGAPLLPPELLMGLGVVCLLLALGLPQLRRRAGRRPHPAEVLMTAGLVLSGLLWFASALLLNGGSRESATPPDAAPLPESASPEAGAVASGATDQLANIGWLAPAAQLVALLSLLGAIVALLWAYRHQSSAATAEAATPGLPLGATLSAPLHRVRVAYREALAALSDAGLGRATHETPAGYAARLGAHHPLLAEALGTLTALYEPVRYGGQLTDEQAGQAEQAARTIQGVAPTLTPTEHPSDQKDLS
ncbi:DUF4129 domain-containing protein [Deinococcus kurensis]|uniref:DUF4129 domain-containing protein n=1 Tax=Deinococcus kurensis TaxID=2662757 RepID=UPI0012D34B38|nr:DUF4129 domain-containing protein [Deinococcus kurensis]